jgi:hypothetical protein
MQIVDDDVRVFSSPFNFSVIFFLAYAPLNTKVKINLKKM